MITLINSLVNFEHENIYDMLQAAYEKLLHCDWDSGSESVIEAYNITAKSYIHYILTIFEEKQINFLSLSDLVYAVHVISMFPLR